MLSEMRPGFATLGFAALCACQPLPAPKPTYYSDVAPLIATQCQECHAPGGIAPMAPSLDEYVSAMGYAEPIQVDVQTRSMPPWLADNSGQCGTWDGARWLSDAQIAMVSEWQEDGAPEGVPDAITAATALPSAPFHSDAVLDIGGVYKPGLGAGGNRCFVADPHTDRDHLLSAIRVVSSDPQAVAQVTLFALDSDAALAAANALDAEETGLGYSCFGTARVPDSRVVASWTWPTPILPMPAGTGVRLPAARALVVQIHYDVGYTGSAFESGTQVELQFSDQASEAQVVPLSADGPLAPGLDSVSVVGQLLVQQRMRIVGVAPRMHIRGKTMNLVAEHGTGSTCVANFHLWSYFNEQLFRASAPRVVEAGDSLRITCDYGTLGRTEPVMFGDAIDDEECLANLFVTY